MQENRYDVENLRFELLENGRCTSFVYHNGEFLHGGGGDENQTSYHLGARIDAFQRGQELSYYHRDEQLSTAYITGGNGGIQNSYLYDAFGNMLDSDEQVYNRILYIGQQYDELTGQYYLRARYYNPILGRFMQEDVYQGDGLNLYAYCCNSPVTYWDLSGYARKSSKSKLRCTKSEDLGTGNDENNSIIPEGTIEAGKPGSPSWKEDQRAIKEGRGKGINVEVESEELARRLLGEARPGLMEYETYTDVGYRAGFEVHPAEPNVGNYLPHIKWMEWSDGKSNGANGHIFFGGD